MRTFTHEERRKNESIALQRQWTNIIESFYNVNESETSGKKLRIIELNGNQLQWL